jgi:hypothetical protein
MAPGVDVGKCVDAKRGGVRPHVETVHQQGDGPSPAAIYTAIMAAVRPSMRRVRRSPFRAFVLSEGVGVLPSGR